MTHLSIRDTGARIEQLASEMDDSDAGHEIMTLAWNLARGLDRIAGALGMSPGVAPRTVADRVMGLVTVELITSCLVALRDVDGIEAEVTSVWPIDAGAIEIPEDFDDDEGAALEHVGWSCGWSAKYTDGHGRSVRFFGCSDEVFGASVSRAGVALAEIIVAHRDRVMPNIIAQWNEEVTP